MFQAILTQIALPLAIKAIKRYINSTDTKKDDKVLDLVQKSANYLAKQDNNTLTPDIAKSIDEVTCDWGD